MPNTSYGFDVYDSIRRVNPEEWNSLRDPEDLYMDLRFIEAVEDSMGSQSRFRHVVVRDAAGRPMASACLSSFVIGGASLAKGVIGKVLTFLERHVPWAVRSKLVLCGLPISAGQSHVRFAPGVDREAALRIIDSVARKFARKEWARLILFKEIDADGCRDLDALLAIGYRRADSYPMNQAPCGFRDFDDYVSRVNWKKRGQIRRSQKKFSAGGLRIEDRLGREGAAELYTDDVHRLYEAVADHSEAEFGRLPAEFFRELARRLPDNTVFTFVYRENQVVGFLASLLHEDTVHALFVGVDYSLNPQCEIYFNILYHFLDIALRRKPRAIFVGQTSDEAKHLKLSCQQVPLSIYVKGGRWTMSLVLKAAFSSLFPPRPICYPRESVELEPARQPAAAIDQLPHKAGTGR